GDGINTLIPMLRHLAEAETQMIERVELVAIKDGHAIFRGKFGGKTVQQIPAEMIVAWAGGIPDDSLYEPLVRSGLNVLRAGDVVRPRRVTEAVADAKEVVDEIIRSPEGFLVGDLN